MIVLMAGLPGTGKTTLARQLATRTGGAVLSKDEIRSAVFTSQGVEFSVEQDDFVMGIMLDACRFMLQKNPLRKIFLDGRTFSRRYQIDRVLQVARELEQTWAILECVCSDSTARRRLDTERDPSHPAANRTFALYLDVRSRFETVSYPKTIISTDQPLDKCLNQSLTALTAAAE